MVTRARAESGAVDGIEIPFDGEWLVADAQAEERRGRLTENEQFWSFEEARSHSVDVDVFAAMTAHEHAAFDLLDVAQWSFWVAPLEPRVQAVLDHQIERLNLLDPSRPHLPFPHSSQIEGELRELRCHFGSSLYRVLYRRSGSLIVLLHIFRKNTGEVPEREIAIARSRFDDFAARMDAPRRRPPRAAGGDAP